MFLKCFTLKTFAKIKDLQNICKNVSFYNILKLKALKTFLQMF